MVDSGFESDFYALGVVYHRDPSSQLWNNSLTFRRGFSMILTYCRGPSLREFIDLLTYERLGKWRIHVRKPSTNVLTPPKLGALREVARHNIYCILKCWVQQGKKNPGKHLVWGKSPFESGLKSGSPQSEQNSLTFPDSQQNSLTSRQILFPWFSLIFPDAGNRVIVTKLRKQTHMGPPELSIKPGKWGVRSHGSF